MNQALLLALRLTSVAERRMANKFLSIMDKPQFPVHSTTSRQLLEQAVTPCLAQLVTALLH